MKSKIFVYLFLLAGCSHQDNRGNQIIDNFYDKSITVVAPGSTCNDNAMSNLLNLVKHRKNITFLPYEGNDHKRAKILKRALLDNNNDIVWTLRGGYGTAKVIEILYDDKEFMLQMKQKKKYPYVVGYSDITALHLFLSQEFGWKTIHGSVFTEVIDQSKDRKNFAAIRKISDGIKEIKICGLEPLNKTAAEFNEINGKITGGNLSIIQTSIGTRWQIDTKDKILIIEDYQEKPYKIDRILNHLKAAGVFDSVKAVIVGDMYESSNEMKNVVLNFAKNINIPFYSIDVFGHNMYNYPFVYNANGRIKAGKLVYLTQNL